MSNLYPPSTSVLRGFPSRFVKVEAHDGSDIESADLLWPKATPNDAFSEGEVLKIEPATGDQVLWFAALESAYRFGGWPTCSGPIT
jgi:hypothetical protein